MSWLLFVFVIIFAFCAVEGWRKGLIRTAVSMISILLVLAMAGWLNPYISDFIRQNTDWQETIKESCKETILSGIDEQNIPDLEGQKDIIEELPLPQTMKNQLIQNNTAETYQKMVANGFADYLAEYIAYGIVNGIAFVVAYIAAVIILKLILYALDILVQLPVIGGVNKLGGMILGAVQGILWIWVAMLVITLICNTEVGQYLMREIEKTEVLSWIYHNNYLVKIVMSFLE